MSRSRPAAPRSFSTLALAACVGLLANCAGPSIRRAAPPSADALPQNAVLITPRVMTPEPGVNCRLQLKSDPPRGAPLVEIEVTSGSAPLSQAELPAGEYTLTQVRCGHHRYALPDPKTAPRIHVLAGNLSYFGGWILQPPAGDSRGDAQWSAAPDLNELRAFLAQLPERERARIISASTGKPVPTEALERGTRLTLRLVAFPAGGKTSQPSLESCFPATEFPPFLGTLRLQARYDARRLESYRLIENRSTASDQTLQCLERRAREFRPRNADRATLTYTVTNR